MPQRATPSVFVAATRQNDGKTMTSLGLFHAFSQRFDAVGYIKPVGQQYRVVDGEMIDKDAVLMSSIYGLQDPLPWMSPVAVPRGFTTSYIESGDRRPLIERIRHAYDALAAEKDFVLIEGTGHAGVGSVFDLSNADVAHLLGSPVVLVSRGGVGKPIDEIMLNHALFAQAGVDVLGVIVNKVDPDRYDRIAATVRKGLERKGIHVFGVVPTVERLLTPSVAELAEDLDARILACDERRLTDTVRRFVIGDMLPHEAVEALEDNCLLIAPGNREDVIVSALCGNLLGASPTSNVCAIVLTDGRRPHHRIMELIERSGVPAMLVEEDSFAIATRINRSIFKLRREETEKVRISQDLVEQNVDVDDICQKIQDVASGARPVARPAAHAAPPPQAPLSESTAALLERTRMLLAAAARREEAAARRERMANLMVSVLEEVQGLGYILDVDRWRERVAPLLTRVGEWLDLHTRIHAPEDARFHDLKRLLRALEQGEEIAHDLDGVSRQMGRCERDLVAGSPERRGRIDAELRRHRQQVERLRATLEEVRGSSRHPHAFTALLRAMERADAELVPLMERARAVADPAGAAEA